MGKKFKLFNIISVHNFLSFSIQTSQMLEQKRQQVMAMEEKCLPIRHYLMKYILPNITEGLTEVAKQRPKHPVEFLGNYLLTHKIKKSEDEIDVDEAVVKGFRKVVESVTYEG